MEHTRTHSHACILASRPRTRPLSPRARSPHPHTEDHRHKLPPSLTELKLVAPAERKPAALAALLRELGGQRTIVFTSSGEAHWLAGRLGGGWWCCLYGVGACTPPTLLAPLPPHWSRRQWRPRTGSTCCCARCGAWARCLTRLWSTAACCSQRSGPPAWTRLPQAPPRCAERGTRGVVGWGMLVCLPCCERCATQRPACDPSNPAGAGVLRRDDARHGRGGRCCCREL